MGNGSDTVSGLRLGLGGAKVMLNWVWERGREVVIMVRKWRWVRVRVFREEGVVMWKVERAVVAADSAAATAAMVVAGEYFWWW